MQTNSNILAQFKALESVNDHNGAASLLIETFGSIHERSLMQTIIRDSNKRGFITHEEIRDRSFMSRKYYHLIRQIN